MSRNRVRQITSRALLGLAACLLGGSQATAALLTSFENDHDGWIINTGENPDYSFDGFSTTDGVTDGTYSAVITGTASPSYGQLLAGPSTTEMTTLLAGASSVSIDVTTAAGAFGFGTQWTASIANDDLGYTSLDGFSYSGFVGPGASGNLSWDLTPAQRATLASSALPTSLIFQVGGGGAGAMYVDNISLTEVPEPAGAVLVAVAGLAAASRRRR